MNDAFTPATLADDLTAVRDVYEAFFAETSDEVWNAPSPRGTGEWTMHEVVAHLCALNGAGLHSIEYGLRGEHYTFEGLDSRYVFEAYNRRGIDQHLPLARDEVQAELLGIYQEAADIARSLTPGQAATTLEMPIYNRPVKIDEALSILVFHTGLGHSAQVADASGGPALWTRFPLDFRHRLVTRSVLPLSLLYRRDFGGDLRAKIAFRVGGAQGGEWHVDVSPDSPTFGEEHIDDPNLVIRLRNTGVFCRMMTGRLNLPLSLATGRMWLRGDIRLFKRMGDLFSVTARPDHEPSEGGKAA